MFGDGELVLVGAMILADAVEDRVPTVVGFVSRRGTVLAVVRSFIVIDQGEHLKVLHLLLTAPDFFHIIERLEEFIIEVSPCLQLSRHVDHNGPLFGCDQADGEFSTTTDPTNHHKVRPIPGNREFDLLVCAISSIGRSSQNDRFTVCPITSIHTARRLNVPVVHI